MRFLSFLSLLFFFMDASQRLLWDHLSQFVQETCQGRDPSHGHAHMQTVAQNALEIYLQFTGNHANLRLVLIAAWLHDVADHKYVSEDPTLLLKLEGFLDRLSREEGDPELAKEVKLVIDHISYSKENRLRKERFGGNHVDWEMILPAHLIEVRDIVSDADKLEAIGMIGVERCLHFAKVQDPNVTEREAVHHLIEHAQEKLLRLKDEYFKTPPAKKMAEPRHLIMLNEINRLAGLYQFPVVA